MNQKIDNYIKWYKAEYRKFLPVTYLDKSTWFKQKIFPFYINWDKDQILKKEVEFNQLAIAKFNQMNFPKKEVSSAILALNNRIEYVSDQSDFYVTYITLIAFTYVVLSITFSFPWNLVIANLIMIGVVLSVKKRVELRCEVSHWKQVVNILNHYISN